MKLTVLDSPNQGPRPAGITPRCIVLHADAASAAASSIAWIMNPTSQVSYHAILERNGDVTQLVPDERRAWHAGKSSWAGLANCNDYAIGVSFSNRNDGLEPFDPRAIRVGVDLVAGYCRRWSIGLDGITTHEAVGRPMGRKTDPGPLFPLAAFITAVRASLSR